MTPQPPSSPEGSSLNPRHRPSLSTFAHDTAEFDLWDFEDETELTEPPPTVLPVNPPVESPLGPPSRFPGTDIPAPRERPGDNPRSSGDSPVFKLPTGGSEQIRINVNKNPAKSRPVTPPPEHPASADDIDDIEDWDQLPENPLPDVPPAVVMPPPVAPVSPTVPAADAPVPETPPPAEITDTPRQQLTDPPKDETKDETKDEFSPVPRSNVAPVSLRPHLGLSAVERIGLALLVLLLLAGGAVILVFSNKHLPREAQRAKANDFPIKGQHLTVDSAVSYWREPITTGNDRDSVRRGTQLLPVLEITAHGGPAAVRVYFRNEDHAVIGDAVTKTVRDGTPMPIPATAGFDDLGMHAAYRTGESKPWIIEVFEAPSENAPGNSFRKLFEMNISTDRH
jgi:hypothetical protein